MVKTFLKLLLLGIVYTVVFMISTFNKNDKFNVIVWNSRWKYTLGK